MFQHIFYLSLLFYGGSSQGTLKVISNGIDIVDPTMFPYFALIIVPYSSEYSLVRSSSCGGSLIHYEWVLTAGHCFPKETSYLDWVSRYTKDLVFMGYTHLKSLEIVRQSRRIKRIIRHPSYEYHDVEDFTDVSYVRNDIALVKVKKKFLPTEVVHTIRLAIYFRQCKSGIAIGAGLTQLFSATRFEDKIKYMKILMNNKISLSKSLFEPSNTTLYGESRVTKVYSQNEGDNFLHGDSGGPVICADVTFPTQIGLLSAVSNLTEKGTIINIIERIDYHIAFIWKYIPDLKGNKNLERSRKHTFNRTSTSANETVNSNRILFLLIPFVVLLYPTLL